MNILSEAVIESNPWWNGRFFQVELKERKFFSGIDPFLEKKQIIGVYGLRRTGKSFLLFHLIKKLLEKEDPQTILYFSFDAFEETPLSELLASAREITGKTPKFVFLDEVQKMNKWAEQIKRAYDLGKIKFVVSGSESLFLKKTSRESLAGRIFEFEMKPLSFREYLTFRDIDISPLHEPEIKNELLSHYLLIGGFPELIHETDAFFVRKYIKEGIIEKAIYQEIPARFRIEDPSLLEKTLNIITDNPGILIDKNNLAQTLGVFRTTASKYLFYLESAFLIKSLYNYSRNASTSEKKLKKYYPGFICLGIGTKNDPTYLGKIAETACVLQTGAKFFWRNPQQDEIDIILEKPLQAIEVKYTETPQTKAIRKFREKFKTDPITTLITKNTEKTENGIQFIPLWKWLLKPR